MERIITLENLRSFAYCNHAIVQGPIRGIAISFMGLNMMSQYEEDPAEAVRLSEKGILYLIPYQNPWAWMNAQTVRLTDELIDVLMEAYNLPENLPIISTGGSMGGQEALTYMVYAKRTPVRCVANCPVCDLPYHYTERPDLPRTLYAAYSAENGFLQQALENHSPLHLVSRMPETSTYIVFHCEEDKAVNKQLHSDRFVAAMRETHSLEYYTVPGRGHCDLPEEMWNLFYQKIEEAV